MSGAESLSGDRIGKGEDSTADHNTKKFLTFLMVPLILIMGMELKEFEDGYIRISNLNGYGALYNRITSLWKPTQSFRLRMLQMDIILFISRIHFLGLPGFLYQKKILEEIGSLAEGVIKLDIKTDNRERGQFIRIADFVDLEKLFTFQVLVNGQLQRVEFEALPEVCLSCGKYGHLKNLCLSSLTDRSGHGGEEIPKSSLSSEIVLAKKRDALPTMGEAFGPWMVVEHKSRRK
ncbi:hypothetical protein Goshw_016421 [Gossypium schwendimanii]|uniref:CCHC-type domain-containing protein n=1 Tax=Gossypium schwendimanii TaxID=34291 RepID=A0A7J9LNQ7_GOSSC|nr:hypothetical protein [Gossypium schwendimanii]